VYTRRLKQMFAGQWSLWRIKERDQQRVLSLGQRDSISARVRQPPRTAVELPGPETAATVFGLSLRYHKPRLPPAQHGANPREKLAKTERFGNVVVSAKFQAHDPVEFVAALASHYNYRNVRTCPDVTQQIETVFLTKSKIQNHNMGLAKCKMPHDFLSLRRRDDTHIVLFQVVDQHLLHEPVIIDDQNALRRAYARLRHKPFRLGIHSSDLCLAQEKPAAVQT
jgi:hypothetical protein